MFFFTRGSASSVLAIPGSATAPSISFSGDNNTGFYNVADGRVGFTSNGTLSSILDGSAVYSNKIAVLSAGSLNLNGGATDGATAIALKLTNAASLTTAGAKISSFYSDNGSTEVAFIDYLGLGHFGKNSGSNDMLGMTTSGNSVIMTMRSVNGSAGMTFSTTKTVDAAAAEEIASVSTTAKLVLQGGASDGASAVAVNIRSNSFTTAGAKILQLTNAGTEKVYFDKDGVTVVETNKRVACGGGSTGAGTTPNGTVTLEINGTSYYLLTSASA